MAFFPFFLLVFFLFLLAAVESVEAFCVVLVTESLLSVDPFSALFLLLLLIESLRLSACAKLARLFVHLFLIPFPWS